MKRLSHTLTYLGTTVDDVFAMLADPSFRKAVADYQHVQDFACEITPAAPGMQVRLEQAHGTERVPAFAQKLVGHEIRFVQEETWAGPAGAEILVTIPGKPGEISGTVAVRQDGADVIERVDLGIRVGIPLVGGKVEDLIAGFLGKAFSAENTVGVKWLTGEWRV